MTGLAEPCGMSLRAVSRHLKVLREAGLVTRTRDAQRRPVHLEAPVLAFMTKWLEPYRRQAEERYAHHAPHRTAPHRTTEIVAGPAPLVRWLGLRSLEMHVDHHDARTGGSYRYVQRENGQEHGFHGSVHEVRLSTLIVQTSPFDGMPHDVALEKRVLDALLAGPVLR